jgi:hypothetical protein
MCAARLHRLHPCPSLVHHPAPQEIDVAAPFPAALGVEDLRVPLVADWRAAMSRVLAGYFLDGRWAAGRRRCPVMVPLVPGVPDASRRPPRPVQVETRRAPLLLQPSERCDAALAVPPFPPPAPHACQAWRGLGLVSMAPPPPPLPGKAAGLQHMGELDCAAAGPGGGQGEDPLECAGIGTGVMMAAWSINATVQNVLAEGLCTDPPAYTRGLANVLVQASRGSAWEPWRCRGTGQAGQLLIAAHLRRPRGPGSHMLTRPARPARQERMLSEEWHTFNTPDLHSDAAVFQFQLMYEHLEMFRRQRWLGERGRWEQHSQHSVPAQLGVAACMA